MLSASYYTAATDAAIEAFYVEARILDLESFDILEDNDLDALADARNLSGDSAYFMAGYTDGLDYEDDPRSIPNATVESVTAYMAGVRYARTAKRSMYTNAYAAASTYNSPPAM